MPGFQPPGKRNNARGCKQDKEKKVNVKTKRTIDKVIEKYEGTHGALLGILEEVQKNNRYNYLPEETLSYVARKTGIPYSKVYGVVTFYSFFSLIPEGEHCISICRGTACHTKGSRNLLDYLRENYEFDGDTGGDAGVRAG